MDQKILLRSRSKRSILACSTKRVEEYLNDSIVALVSSAVLIKHKRAEAAEQSRIRAEAADRRRQEQEKQERARKRREFLFEKASEHSRLQTLVGFLDHLERVTTNSSSGPVARLAGEMHAVVNEVRERLGHDALEAESNRLQLYIDDDIAG